MGNFKDITGHRFSRLTVIRISHHDVRGQIHWLCRCDCGQEAIVNGYSLQSSYTRSCGCLRNEKTRERTIIRNYRHGQSKTALYRCWKEIIRRCTCPTSSSYKWYGKRGVSVCSRWLGKNGFNCFAADMGPRPEGRFSIERLDVNGNYEPNNCIWIPHADQAKNRRPGDQWAHEIRRNPDSWLRGERNPVAKLTDNQVRSIRLDNRSASQIAREHAVSISLIYAVKHRKIWRHVLDD